MRASLALTALILTLGAAMAAAPARAQPVSVTCPAGVTGIDECFCDGDTLQGIITGDPFRVPVDLQSGAAACAAGGGGETGAGQSYRVTSNGRMSTIGQFENLEDKLFPEETFKTDTPPPSNDDARTQAERERLQNRLSEIEKERALLEAKRAELQAKRDEIQGPHDEKQAKLASDLAAKNDAITAAQQDLQAKQEQKEKFEALLNDPAAARAGFPEMTDREFDELVRFTALGNLSLGDQIDALEDQIAADQAAAGALLSQIGENKAAFDSAIASTDQSLQAINGELAALGGEEAGIKANLAGLNQRSGSGGVPGSVEALRRQGLEAFVRADGQRIVDRQAARNASTDIGSLTIGVFGRVTEPLLLGLTLGLDHSDVNDRSATNRDIDAFGLTLAVSGAYALTREWALDGSLAYQYSDSDTDRGGVSGSFDSHGFAITAGVNHFGQFARHTRYTLRLGHAFAKTRSEGFTESDGTANASASDDFGRLTLSGVVRHDLGVVEPFVSLSGSYDTIRQGAGIGRFQASPSAGITANLWGGASLTLEAGGVLARDDFDSVNAAAELRIQF